MENSEWNEVLLDSSSSSREHKKSSLLINNILKWIMKITMCLFFILWIAIIFMYPLQSFESFVQKWTTATSSSFLGFTGSAVVLFSGPIIVISMISILYSVLDDDLLRFPLKRKIEEKPRYRLGTFPVIVKGPFGVISAAEMIGIMIFGLYLIWVAVVYAHEKLSNVFNNPEYTTAHEKWSEFLRECGKGCGLAGLFCLWFGMITAARGSFIFRLLNIPTQQTLRYHIWVSHLSLSLFTFHALLYLVAWFLVGGIPSKLILWQSTEEAHLPGVINILIGWTIWITSLPFVRKKNFELFYYTHYLYIIFIVLLSMHIGNFLFCIVAGPIFLFIIDYFLRFCRSSNTVHVISATTFPCGVLELVLPMPQNIKHDALSFIFLRVKEVSLLQWHPFSVSAINLDGKNRIAVLIKGSGNWTSQLQDKALNHPAKLTVSMEGPYGYDLHNHLRCKYLILVAGGIGISPFIAVLNDLIDGIKLGKPNIILVWTIKTSDNLSLLSTLDCLVPFGHLKSLQIIIYVTREFQPHFEAIMLQKPMPCIYSSSKRNSIPVPAGSGNKIWLITFMFSATIGFIIILSTINIFYVRPFRITTWWFQALLLLVSMLSSVLIFCGGTVGLWHILEKKKHMEDAQGTTNEDQSNQYNQNNNSFFQYFSSLTTFHYGSRANFKEIFASVDKVWGHVDVGVLVCGPPSLEESVAGECRSYNFTRKSNQPIFHFNSHSFSF